MTARKKWRCEQFRRACAGRPTTTHLEGRNCVSLDVSEQEFHTILAALRFYEERGQGEPANRSNWIHDLATNGGQVISLDDAGIDDLCERLNLDSRYTPEP